MYELNMRKIKNAIIKHNEGIKDFEIEEILSISLYEEDEEVVVDFSFSMNGKHFNNGWQRLTFNELNITYYHEDSIE